LCGWETAAKIAEVLKLVKAIIVPESKNFGNLYDHGIWSLRTSQALACLDKSPLIIFRSSPLPL
jgi:hypothetical protein